ncbi:MAG TPA: tetratricopeptide repeat protein [Blastocatellia bacterium]|nr:tetratricopeptide repeat protein [Blastocatellia bacterium]
MSMLTRHFYEFGPFRIDAEKRQLMREGQAVPLKPKAFDMLLALVQHRGRVLEKDDLMGMLWPDSDVEESNLPLHISALRKALGESPHERGYIVTVPGRGYRFEADVEEFDNAGQDLILEKYTQSTILIQEQNASPDDAIKALPATRISSGRLKLMLGGLTILVVISLLALGSWLGLSKKTERQPGTLLIQSLAVLPFRQLGSGDDEYMGLGIADSLITRLSNLREIKIRPTSAVLKYDNEPKQPTDSGRELGVEAVLEGSIHRDGENVRVTVQLVRVADGSTLWAEKFDDRFTGIFKIEDSISGRVAESLVSKLTGKEREVVAKHYTENTEAWQLYLKGRVSFNKLTPEAVKKSIDYFQQATEGDPGYALAFVGLSDCYGTLPLNSDVPPREAFLKAKQAAARALEIDAQLPEAHVSMGSISFWFDWDWAKAESHLKRAIDLNPNNPLAHFKYAHLLYNSGRFEEGEIEVRRALELDPVSPIINSIMGQFLFEARQYDQAIHQLDKALDIEPNLWLTHLFLGKVYEQKGMYNEALIESQKALQFSGGNTEASSLAGHTYAVSGNKKQAEKVLGELKKLSKQGYVPASNIALIYVGLGETNQALDWLEKAYDERDVHVTFLKTVSHWDSIRQEPRFTSLLQRASF